MKEFIYHVDLSGIKLADDEKSCWLHAMPIGKIEHPFYGTMDFSVEALTKYASNVKSKVLGKVDPVIDYDHMMFNGLAAGWVKDARVDEKGDTAGLNLFVEWNDDAVSKVRTKEYRYFSPTFTEAWKDNAGKEHENVIMGGALTNRPFLKNLVPVNLSELQFVPVNNPEPVQEAEVDMKMLREVLGLSADTSDEETLKAFKEKLSAAPAPDPTPPPTPVPAIQMSAELKALAESNPTIKALLSAFEAQAQNTKEMQKNLRENEIVRELDTLDKTDLVVTPASRELIAEVARGLSDDLAPKFWDLMRQLSNSSAFLVELGERSGSNVKRGNGKTAIQLLNERAESLIVEKKLSYPDAMELAASEDPTLYKRYRDELMSQGV